MKNLFREHFAQLHKTALENLETKFEKFFKNVKTNIEEVER